MASMDVKQLTQMPADSTGASRMAPLTATVGIVRPVPPPALVAVGATVATAATVAVAVGEKVYRGEAATARALYDLPAWSTTLMRALMQAGTRAAILVIFVALLVAGRRRAALIVGSSGAAAWLTARVLKEIVDRPRPTLLSLARPLREVVEGPGYPSTHAAVATALAVALVLTVPMLRVLAVTVVTLAVVTALARVHLGVHWPLDVIGAMGIGMTTAGLATQFGRRRSQPEAVDRR